MSHFMTILVTLNFDIPDYSYHFDLQTHIPDVYLTKQIHRRLILLEIRNYPRQRTAKNSQNEINSIRRAIKPKNAKKKHDKSTLRSIKKQFDLTSFRVVKLENNKDFYYSFYQESKIILGRQRQKIVKMKPILSAEKR